MIINNWRLFYFRLFELALSKLEIDVKKLAKKNPKKYKTHPKARLLASIYKVITTTIPNDPNDNNYRLGKTLGKNNTNWRRIKKGMPDRYRLFFRFNSLPIKLIVYVWFNDENTLRKIGSKTDVYEVFKKMLSRGEVPTSLDQLLKQSSDSR